MNNLYRVTFGLCLILFSTFNSAFAGKSDGQFSDTTIETIPLGSGIYMLTGEGGNIGLSVGEDGIFIIDDQFAPLTEKIKAAIAKLSDQPIRFAINTHWHFDHTGGNENLAKENVIIVAHDNVRERMSRDNVIAAFNMEIPASPKAALPLITFNDEVTFHLNNEEIHVVHQPNAHTDGDSIIFFKDANIIHMGDIFFNGLYPFIDASSNGNIAGIINTVDHILEITDDKTKIIPGHGPLGDKKSLLIYRNMLVTVKERMQNLIDQGKTLEEIISMMPNADLDETWGKGFLDPEAFLRVLHSTMPKS
ncbi:MBL-fold metallo-hydrolase superfamily [hydrothermal vent metagenome]|uniref:MBL-fold metallo-hydrolase superfamily n=1 Tax=hydrothermal vent metagenome TaxID=652676 RepID=A0A3B0ZYZ8_9ZZZZ